MPDIYLRDVDNETMERVRTLAQERGCSLDDVLHDALRRGLNEASALTEMVCEADELNAPASSWDASERAVFHEAMHALTHALGSSLHRRDDNAD